MDYITVIGIGVSLILACAGAFFTYRCWKLWKHTNITSLGLWVTKDRSFLTNNFKLIIVIGALSGLHVLFELWERFVILSTPFIRNIFYLFYFLNLVSIMIVFLMLAVAWYKMLSKVNIWDKRWLRADNK